MPNLLALQGMHAVGRCSCCDLSVVVRVQVVSCAGAVRAGDPGARSGMGGCLEICTIQSRRPRFLTYINPPLMCIPCLNKSSVNDEFQMFCSYQQVPPYPLHKKNKAIPRGQLAMLLLTAEYDLFGKSDPDGVAG